MIFSTLKKLNYLPIEVFIDFSNNFESTENEVFIGGSLTYNDKINLNFGTSVRKITQNLKQSFLQIFLGDTGYGFSYKVNKVVINYGSFIYSNGILVHSLEIGIPF